MFPANALRKQPRTMLPLNAMNSADEKEITYISFLNLTLNTGRPDFIGANQTVQQTVVALRKAPRLKLLHAPLVLDTNANIFKLLVRRQVAGFEVLVRYLVPQDMKHLLFHRHHLLRLGN